CERAAQMLHNTIAITHPLGRCQIATDLALTRRTLEGHGKNPNAGAVVVVDHFKEEGCTADEIAHEIAKTGKPVEVVNIRRSGGLLHALEEALRAGINFLRKITPQRRERVSVSKLVMGINCGTSDVTSGIAHNRATGYVTDKIVELGGRVIMAETTEMMGAEDILAGRCINESVAQKLYGIVQRMEKRILACGVDLRGSQPTGDNIIGGLTTIEEKSLGAIQKAGQRAPIIDVIEYAEQIGTQPGIYVMDTPGHGGESITGIAAGGAPVLIFSTGGGHTINHPLMITIRVSGNPESVRLMADTTDVDVSDMLTGTSVEEAGERLYAEVLAVASGKFTTAEAIKEYNAFAIHRLGPSV
ncbi:MAG TPA: hypothetical protein EYP10_10210, partial [Armatimonadetes bacterium]|nr:hypothetical protein [Armatimonadota bacterium]